MLIAQVMRDEIGTEFVVSISGVVEDKKQIWCRIVHGKYAGVEGRLLADMYDTLKVGDRCTVRLASVKPAYGFIDFTLAPVQDEQ